MLVPSSLRLHNPCDAPPPEHVNRLYTASAPGTGDSGAVPVLAAGLDSGAGTAGNIVLAATDGTGNKANVHYKALRTAAVSFVGMCAKTHSIPVHGWAIEAGKAVTTATNNKSAASTASGIFVTTPDVQGAAIDGVLGLISGANAVGPAGAEFKPASAMSGLKKAVLDLAADVGRTAHTALKIGIPTKKMLEATGCQELLLVLKNVAALFAAPDDAPDVAAEFELGGTRIQLFPPPKLQSYYLEHTTSTQFGCLLETTQKLLAADVAARGGIKKARDAITKDHAADVLANLGLHVEQCTETTWYASVHGRIQQATELILTPAGFGDTELLRGLVLAAVESVRACMRVVCTCTIKVAATVLTLVLSLSRASISTGVACPHRCLRVVLCGLCRQPDALLDARAELHAFGFVASTFGAQVIHAVTAKAYTSPAQGNMVEPNRARVCLADVTALLAAVQARKDPGSVPYDVNDGRDDTTGAGDDTTGDCSWVTALRGLVQEEYLEADVVLPLVLQALFAPGSSISVWLPRDAPDHAESGGAPVKIDVTEFGPSGYVKTAAVRHKVFGSPGQGASHHMMLSTCGDMLFKKARVTDASLTWLDRLNHYAPLVEVGSEDLLVVGRRQIHGALGFNMARYVTAQLAESVFGQDYLKKENMEVDALAVATKISNAAADAVQVHAAGANVDASSTDRTNLIIVALDPLFNGPLLFVSSIAAVMSCIVQKLRTADPNGKSEIDKLSDMLRAGTDDKGVVELLNRQQFREVLIAAAKESQVDREKLKAESMATEGQPSAANDGAPATSFEGPSLVERLRQSQTLSAAASAGLSTTDVHRALAQLTLAGVIQELPALRDAVNAKDGTAGFLAAITRMGMRVETSTIQALQQDLIRSGGTLPAGTRLRMLCNGLHKDAMVVTSSTTTSALRHTAKSGQKGGRKTGMLAENMLATDRVRTAPLRLADSQDAAAPPSRNRNRNRPGKGKGKGKGKGTGKRNEETAGMGDSSDGEIDGEIVVDGETWDVCDIVDFVADWDNSRILVVVDWGTQKANDAVPGRSDAVRAAWVAARGPRLAAQTARYTLEHKGGVSAAQWDNIVKHASFNRIRDEFEQRQDAGHQARSSEPSSSDGASSGDGKRRRVDGTTASTSSRPPPLLNVDDTNKVISQLRAVGNVDLAVMLEASLAEQAEAAK